MLLDVLVLVVELEELVDDVVGTVVVTDELVEVVVETPRHLSPRQEELLREFAEIEHEQVSPRRKSFFEKLRDYFTEEEEPEEASES